MNVQLTSARANTVFRTDLQRIVHLTDRMFLWLLLGQWAFAIALAVVWSPRTWIAERWSIHEHVLAAAFLGGLFAAWPIYCILRHPGTRLTRHSVAIGQMLQSALLVHVTGGRIETHFHVFGSLALLAFYRDWSVLVTASAVVYLDHTALGLWFPLSAYGVDEATFWRSAEHAFWVCFEVVFLAMACKTGIQELSAIAERQAEAEAAAADLRTNNAKIQRMSEELQKANEVLETRVEERTQALKKEISDRQQAEQVLAQAHEDKIMAEAANRAKNEFLSRMSHELRTPLNAILGFGQLLEMSKITDEQGECVDQINRGGKHLLGLINEVLDIARIEAGRMDVSLEPVRVSDALQEAMDLVRPLGLRHRIQFHTDIPETDARCVLADSQKLKQVLLNLLSNAVKYNREGGTVRFYCEEPRPGRLQLIVSDTGAGIQPEQLARLFVPFDRLGAEQTGVEGSGLGLSLSKGLVELMGGTLTVTSAVGLGSRFCVELALAEPPQEQVAWDFEHDAQGSGVGFEGRTILYVEDNLDNVRLLQRILAHRPGVRLLTAMQGRLGLELARQHRPDLIFLDVHLPDLKAEEVLHQLQAASETHGIPVIIISADATRSQIDRLRGAGARDYLTKPIDVPRFLKIVDEMFKAETLASC